VARIKNHLPEIIVFSAVILLLSIGTYARNALWNDEIGLWVDCIRKSPHKGRAYVNLGFAYFNAGDYDRSLELTKKALEIDSKSASAYYNLSLTLQKLGDLDQAIEMAKKSLLLDPDLQIAYYSLGGLYFERRDYGEAERAFTKFIKVYPYFPGVHNLLAIVYAAQKRFDQAIAEFECEVQINPYQTLAHLNLGQIYLHEFHDRQKALRHFKIALMIDPFLPNRAMIQRLVRALEGGA
jgi:protein O-mannosyl-transferase